MPNLYSLLKSVSSSSIEKFSYCLALPIVGMIILSCNNSDEKEAGVNGTQAQVRATSSNNDKLYALYLENTSTNPQLDSLYKRGKKKDKAVFQFYRTDSATLGLIAYPSDKKNAEFHLADKRKLQISSFLADSMNGREVVLGDLQFAIDNLDKYIVPKGGTNQPGYEFIWFVPVVRKDTSTGLNYVFYKVRASAETPKASFAASDIGEANPSPPRPIE